MSENIPLLFFLQIANDARLLFMIFNFNFFKKIQSFNGSTPYFLNSMGRDSWSFRTRHINTFRSGSLVVLRNSLPSLSLSTKIKECHKQGGNYVNNLRTRDR